MQNGLHIQAFNSASNALDFLFHHNDFLLLCRSTDLDWILYKCQAPGRRSKRQAFSLAFLYIIKDSASEIY